MLKDLRSLMADYQRRWKQILNSWKGLPEKQRGGFAAPETLSFPAKR
jgi:hypothetical protein